LWRIESPAQGAEFDNDAQLACSGRAATNGTTWKLIVTASTITANVTGSSANNAWSGTAVPSTGSGNWPIGNATAVLKEDGDIEDTKQFGFKLP
jgi:hypothetical protein